MEAAKPPPLLHSAHLQTSTLWIPPRLTAFMPFRMASWVVPGSLWALAASRTTRMQGPSLQSGIEQQDPGPGPWNYSLLLGLWACDAKGHLRYFCNALRRFLKLSWLLGHDSHLFMLISLVMVACSNSSPGNALSFSTTWPGCRLLKLLCSSSLLMISSNFKFFLCSISDHWPWEADTPNLACFAA